MLVADVGAQGLQRLKRLREGLRVFAALDEAGRISPEMMEGACRSVSQFQREAFVSGAERVHLFATSAVRDATNGDRFAQALNDATGLSLEIISGEREAYLSYVGAAEGGDAGMIDIGGGSTEVVMGAQGRVQRSASLQMGAVRLFRMHPITGLEDALRVAGIAGDTIRNHPELLTATKPKRWVGVGGTFTTSAAVLQRIPWDRRERIHGYTLEKQALLQAIGGLAPMPLSERMALPSMQPKRADIVVHGMAILLGCMEALGIDRIAVSECGNLEGYLKAAYGLVA